MADKKPASADFVPSPAQENAAQNKDAGVVMRSGIAGVAVAILAAAVASPAGLGGLVGVAEGMSLDPQDAEASAHAMHLPSMKAPLSEQDLSSIDRILEQSAYQMSDMQAATDGEIEHLHDLAQNGRLDLRD